MNTFRELISSMSSRLTPIYGNRETQALIQFIFRNLKGWKPVDLVMNYNKEPTDYILSHTENAVTRLLRNEPIQYIFGSAHFYGMDLKVSPAVLIPRPETAELVDMIVGDNNKSDLRVLDIGTGSGCIAIAIARNLRFPKVTAIDISQKAIDIASENATNLNTHIQFLCTDIFDFQPDGNSFDIFVSNPPYIDHSEIKSMEANVVNYEPHSALFVPDNDSLKFYRRINNLAINALTPGGKLYYEINPNHAEKLAEETANEGFCNVSVHLDTSGKKRFLAAIKP